MKIPYHKINIFKIYLMAHLLLHKLWMQFNPNKKKQAKPLQSFLMGKFDIFYS